MTNDDTVSKIEPWEAGAMASLSGLAPRDRASACLRYSYATSTVLSRRPVLLI